MCWRRYRERYVAIGHQSLQEIIAEMTETTARQENFWISSNQVGDSAGGLLRDKQQK
jgi:hypothetical protein